MKAPFGEKFLFILLIILLLSGCSYVRKAGDVVCQDNYNGLETLIVVPACVAVETTYIGLKCVDYVSSAYIDVPIMLASTAFSATPSYGKAGGKFKAHGNWCGPGNPPEGTYPSPIDSLDKACMKHDLCYAERGYNNCQCDRKLVKDILNGKAPIQSNLSPLAWSMVKYFQYSECN